METPVYKRLGETIRRRINEGVYPLGSQLPTELEMVNEFNVSRMTVSKGLTELIEAGIIKRIRGKGTFVCSQKFEAIDSKSEIPVIKCILPGAIYEQSFASNALLQGVCAELKNTPYQTGIAFCGNEDEILAELGKAESDNCAGYILWPRESKRFCEAVGKLQAAGFPLILLDSFFPEYQGEFIGTDNFAGAETAVDCLVAHGHRRIGYLDGFTCIGDMEFCGKRDDTHQIEARTTALCIVLPLASTKELLLNDNRFLRYLLNSVTEKLMLYSSSQSNFSTLEESFLSYLSERCPDQTFSGVEKMAMQLHCSRRQLQRVLKKLLEEGQLVKLSKGSYRLS